MAEDTIARASVALGVDKDAFLNEIKGVADLGGKSMGEGLSSALKAFAPIGIAAGIGGALLDIGSKFEESFNTIIAKTGATGQALKGLEGDFKSVLATTPGATFQNVADALSEVAVRTHLAGAPLEDLTAKFVELGKVTGTDVAGDVQSATALFNNFGVAAANQSAELDVLFKASQASGVAITDLTSQMQVAAPAAQTLGLNFNQTAALVAQLTEAGLPASRVMMGLSAEFAKAAKEGKDPTTVIGDMVTAIKAAPDATAAATLAIKDFGIGARQAATLVDAVRSGSLNFGATLGAITNGAGGIKATADATLTLGDRFKIFKNEALVALEPVAAKVLEFADTIAEKLPAAFQAVKAALAPVFDWVISAWNGVVEGFGNDGPLKGAVGIWRDFETAGGVLRDSFEAVKGAVLNDLVPAFNVIGPAIEKAFVFLVSHKETLIGTLVAVGTIVAATVVPAFVSWAAATVVAIAPVIAIGAAIAALVAGVIYAYEHFQTFRVVINDVAKFLTGTVWPALQTVAKGIVTAFSAVVGWFQKNWSTISAVVQTGVKIVSGELGIVVDVVRAVVSQISDEVSTWIAVFQDVISFFENIFQGHWSAAFNALADIPKRIFGLIEDTVGNFVSIFTNLPGQVTSWLASVGSALLGFFTSLPGRVNGWLASLGSALANAFVSSFSGLVKALPGMLADTAVFFTIGLPADLISWTIEAGSWLIGVGVKILTGLYNDAVAGLPIVARFFTDLPGNIAGFVGDATKWLIGIGIKMVTGLYNDAVAGLPVVAKFFTDLPGNIVTWTMNAGSWLIGVGKTVMGGFVDGLNGAADLISHVFDGIVGIFTGAVNDIIGAINTAIGAYNSIPSVLRPTDKITPISPIGAKSPSGGDQIHYGLNAAGTDYWQGGPTWVGEQGPELLNVPRGGQILSHQEIVHQMSALQSAPATGPRQVIENLNVTSNEPEQLATDLVRELKSLEFLAGV